MNDDTDDYNGNDNSHGDHDDSDANTGNSDDVITMIIMTIQTTTMMVIMIVIIYRGPLGVGYFIRRQDWLATGLTGKDVSANSNIAECCTPRTNYCTSLDESLVTRTNHPIVFLKGPVRYEKGELTPAEPKK